MSESYAFLEESLRCAVSLFLSRGDSMGDDVIWGGTVCVCATSGCAEFAGEG